MPTGAITGYIDVAQLVLYAFWIFFAGLILYLRREDKREGYPLVSERSAHVTVQGFPPVPAPKTFLLPHGGSVTAPRQEAPERTIAARAQLGFLGAPLVPTGDPMQDGVGPAAWAGRADEPELTLDNLPLIVPIHASEGAYVEPRDPDPRGMPVVCADKRVGGTVRELWIDRAEPQVRYLEVEVTGGRRVLLPITMALVQGDRGRVLAYSVLADQLAAAPGTKSPDRVTKLEEDRIAAYFGGGELYATPARQEPLL